ncbi:MAG TPA: ferrochelatase [Candidatus Acidoferrales bacterium]|nr:ferrochelatase [Candidatus Acidoferrales bacterium]
MTYDALLIVSFGGPEKSEEVIPFLENVLRGRNVPRERMLQVAEHYYHFGGRSPINDQCRALIAALDAGLKAHGPSLPIYWGNRNWHPMLADTLRRMRDDGIRRSLALVTSAFGSYSGCRQYREDIERARAAVGQDAPEIHKLRTFHNHPGYIAAAVDRVRIALEQVPAERRSLAKLVFTAHSIPVSMAQSSPYVAQLAEARDLVCEALGRPPADLVYQSRSGPPNQPWLEPDICDYIRRLHSEGAPSHLVIAPIGFLSDHMEVVYDLDTEAAALCRDLGVNLVRAGTVGVHPAFICALRELILERTAGHERRALGVLGPAPDECPADCCPPARPGPRGQP